MKRRIVGTGTDDEYIHRQHIQQQMTKTVTSSLGSGTHIFEEKNVPRTKPKTKPQRGETAAAVDAFIAEQKPMVRWRLSDVCAAYPNLSKGTISSTHFNRKKSGIICGEKLGANEYEYWVPAPVEESRKSIPVPRSAVALPEAPSPAADTPEGVLDKAQSDLQALGFRITKVEVEPTMPLAFRYEDGVWVR